MRTVQAGELDGIADEEDRKIVADDIPVTLVCEHLKGETSDISHRIGRTPGTSDGGETGKNLGLLANLVKEVCRGNM